MPIIKNLSNVNVGTSPNAGDGDLVRDAFIKINDNINKIYSGGQVVSYNADSRLAPGFTWSDDKDTGFFRPASGRIGVALNGAEALVMSNDGSLKWYTQEVATQSYVNAALSSFTGGLSSSNISISTGGGTATVQVNGLPVVSSLPSLGNYVGRIIFYAGDVWIYTNYPVGNGVGLAANPSIARLAGSDSRWVRFRGDAAFSTGSVKPATAAEGTVFYETANAKAYFYVSGSWRTLASIVGSNTPSGFNIVTSLPLTGDPSNYEGRTVVIRSSATSYIFISGAWQPLSSYIGGISSGGVPSGPGLPTLANVGDLFRKTGTNSGLYIWDSGIWQTLGRYSSNTGILRIPTLTTIPTNLSAYDPGSVIIVGGTSYILNSSKTAWDFYTPGGVSGSITGIVLNPNQVGTAELSANAVVNTKIASNTITGNKLVANAITAREIADGAVTASTIANNSIISLKIQESSITNREIASNSISGTKIQTGSIDKSKLAANALTGVSVSANSLSEISTNLGTIRSGALRTLDGRMIIDLTNRIIRLEI